MIVLPAVIRALGNARLLPNVLPVLVLLAIWFAIFLPTRKRKLRKLQHEIDELRGFEREAQS